MVLKGCQEVILSDFGLILGHWGFPWFREGGGRRTEGWRTKDERQGSGDAGSNYWFQWGQVMRSFAVQRGASERPNIMMVLLKPWRNGRPAARAIPGRGSALPPVRSGI